MTRDVADSVSLQLSTDGYDHARFVVGDQHRIEMKRDRLDGADLLKLMAILVPNGTPIPGVTVSLQYARGLVVE